MHSVERKTADDECRIESGMIDDRKSASVFRSPRVFSDLKQRGLLDDFSPYVVKNPVHIHELNATILHCLGIDHQGLTSGYGKDYLCRSPGHDFRLTDVHPILAQQRRGIRRRNVGRLGLRLPHPSLSVRIAKGTAKMIFALGHR